MNEERAQKIVDATIELTLRPQQGDRARVIAVALRAAVNELRCIGITEKNILELVGELEALKKVGPEGEPEPPSGPVQKPTPKAPEAQRMEL